MPYFEVLLFVWISYLSPSVSFPTIRTFLMRLLFFASAFVDVEFFFASGFCSISVPVRLSVPLANSRKPFVFTSSEDEIFFLISFSPSLQNGMRAIVKVHD